MTPSSAAIERIDPPEAHPASLMTVIERLASNPNVDIDKLRQLLEMQERWEINRDKSALRHGMAEFKKNPPEIIKSRVASVRMKEEKGGGNFTYSFADLEIITTAIQGDLAERGITHSYSTTDTGALISVTCILKYGLYEEPGVTLSAGPDMSGTKNSLQGKGSTLSYLEKYSLLAATGMAAGMPDTDGNPTQHGMDADTVSALVGRLEKCATLVDLQQVFAEVYQVANKADDKNATGRLIRARDERKKQLKEAAQQPATFGPRIAEPLVVERLTWIEDAMDMAELKRIYNNALKMANEAGDEDFKARLVKASNARAEVLHADNR